MDRVTQFLAVLQCLITSFSMLVDSSSPSQQQDFPVLLLTRHCPRPETTKRARLNIQESKQGLPSLPTRDMPPEARSCNSQLSPGWGRCSLESGARADLSRAAGLGRCFCVQALQFRPYDPKHSVLLKIAFQKNRSPKQEMQKVDFTPSWAQAQSEAREGSDLVPEISGTTRASLVCVPV